MGVLGVGCCSAQAVSARDSVAHGNLLQLERMHSPQPIAALCGARQHRDSKVAQDGSYACLLLSA